MSLPPSVKASIIGAYPFTASNADTAGNGVDPWYFTVILQSPLDAPKVFPPLFVVASAGSASIVIRKRPN